MPEVPPDAVVFVHVAALARYRKAQHLAVEALGRLPREANAYLRICGGIPQGGNPEYLVELKRRAVELGIQDRVHFLGWRDDALAVIGRSTVCILPSISHSESFGLVLVEAMAQGKPCIGSTFGGVPEVIEGGVTGLVCEPTAEKIAAAMTRMIESEETRRSMGQAGRRRVETVLSLDRQAAGVDEVIRCAVTNDAEY